MRFALERRGLQHAMFSRRAYMVAFHFSPHLCDTITPSKDKLEETMVTMRATHHESDQHVPVRPHVPGKVGIDAPVCRRSPVHMRNKLVTC
eukprot:2248785-Pyramimonas_sp.AAC.3